MNENGSGFGNSRFEEEQSAESGALRRNRAALGFGIVLLLIAVATGGYFYTRNVEVSSTASPETSALAPAHAESSEAEPTVRQMPETPRVKFETSYFAFRKANLNKATRLNLSKAAQVLKENKELRVRVAGYADEIGTKQFNQKLSERRAHNAAQFLIKAGIDADRISVIGFGENRPAVMGKDERSRQLNRRVEVDVIVSLPSVATKR